MLSSLTAVIHPNPDGCRSHHEPPMILHCGRGIDKRHLRLGDLEDIVRICSDDRFNLNLFVGGILKEIVRMAYSTMLKK
jgi:pyridoxine 5'-phosphate synthase PdxJ